MKKRILQVKHRKSISYLEARKLVENSVVTITYANVAKPTNNSTQNQGMTCHEMIIKELKTLIELLREILTNLTIKPHAKPDPKKNLQLQTNEADPPQSNQTKTNLKHLYYPYQTQ